MIMKIAVACMESGGLDDGVAPIFGASGVYTIVEAEDQTILGTEIVQNESIGVVGAAGTQSVAALLEKGIDAVIAGNFSPNAADIISSAGVTMYRLQNMSVGDAVKQYLNRATDGKVRGERRGDVPTGYATLTSGGDVTLRARRRDWGRGPTRRTGGGMRHR